MKKIFIPFLTILGLVGAFVAHAAIKPIPGAEIIARKQCPSSTSICPTVPGTATFKFTTTGTDGAFSLGGLEPGAPYDVYYGNESLPPIIITKATTAGTISGKLIIDIYGENKTKFAVGEWNSERLSKLKEILAREKVMSETIDLAKTPITDTTVRNCIKAFQKKYNITQTGTIGPITTQKLNDLVEGE